MGGTWTDNEILAEIGKRSWYHKIQLRPGIATPGVQILEPLWDSTRKSRAHINYPGKRVLDIASFDGMWAFEAEQLGASLVVATDCMQPLYSNFESCKDILGSKVLPLYNVSPYNLWEGLKVLLMDDFSVPLPFPQHIRHNLFDIVQHTGLLYHVRDPLWTLSQARSVIKTGGHLLLETACIMDDLESRMIFSGPPGQMNRIYHDITTYWIPSIKCLREMLASTLFEVLPQSVTTISSGTKNNYPIGRVTMVARAISGSETAADSYAELLRIYRNPGLVPDYL